MKTKFANLHDQAECRDALAELKIKSRALVETLELVSGKAPTIPAPTLRGDAGSIHDDLEAMDEFCGRLQGLIIAAKNSAPAAPSAVAPAAPVKPAAPKLSPNARILLANGYDSNGKKLTLDEQAKVFLEANPGYFERGLNRIPPGN